MDQVTAALLLVSEAFKLWRLLIESAAPEDRARFAKLALEDMERRRDFVDRIASVFGRPIPPLPRE